MTKSPPALAVFMINARWVFSSVRCLFRSRPVTLFINLPFSISLVSSQSLISLIFLWFSLFDTVSFLSCNYGISILGLGLHVWGNISWPYSICLLFLFVFLSVVFGVFHCIMFRVLFLLQVLSLQSKLMHQVICFLYFFCQMYIVLLRLHLLHPVFNSTICLVFFESK